jgi:hypothetical protein
VPRTSARRRNVLTHLTAAIVVPGCIALCWWQVTRALSGNSLSWAYVFEWPIFAGYAVFMWWKLIHEPRPGERSDSRAPSSDTGPRTDGAGKVPTTGPIQGRDLDGGQPGSGPEAAEDEELASYNRYLAALHDSGKRKRW